MKVLAIIIGIVVGLVILLLATLKLLVFLSDKGAERKGKKYCLDRGYRFKKVEAYPNHYGLFLEAEKMQIYASFHYERDGSFTWIKGSPEEKIAARKEKKAAKNKS